MLLQVHDGPFLSIAAVSQLTFFRCVIAFFKGLSVLQNAASDVEIVQMAFEGNLTKLLKAVSLMVSSRRSLNTC